MYTIQQDRQILNRPQRSQRCGTGKKERPKKRSPRTLAPDFLRHSFTPIIALPEGHISSQEAQAHFYASLRNIESVYKLKKTPLSKRPYPYNIMDAFHWAKEQVDKKNCYTKLFLIENGRFPYCLATATTWDTGYHLYYISFDALLRISRSRRCRKETGLFFSACAYLFQIVEMPSYAAGGMVSSIYEQVWDYKEQEHFEMEEEQDDDTDVPEPAQLNELLAQRMEQEQEFKTAAHEMGCADYFGRKIQKSISHPRNLMTWEHRIKHYRPKDKKGKELLVVSQKLFDLYRQYPDRNFYQQYCARHWYSENDCIMHASEYFSFVWSIDGWLGDQSYQFTNDMSGSYDGIDEPLQYKIYDVPSTREANNLDFEKRLFALVDELSFLLYNYFQL